MTLRNKADTGTTIVVWNSSEGFIHVNQHTNGHETHLWRDVIADALGHFGLTGDPTEEVCGYLERVPSDAPWITMRAVRVENTAGDEGEFMFSMDDSIKVFNLIETGDCLGIWHTHPNGNPNPSESDWLGHPRNVNVPMFIVALSLEMVYQASVVRYEETDRP